MSAIHAIRVPQAQLGAQESKTLDLAVVVPTLALVALGIAMVFSASIPLSAVEQSGDVYLYLKRELLFAGVGLLAMWGTSRIPMARVQRQAGTLLALAVSLLVLVLFVGVRVNGAMAWLPIPGTGLRFQPSEMAKLVLVIVAARYFAKFPRGLPNWRRALPPFIVLGGVCALIAVEPDMGTAAVLGAAMLVYYHIAGAKLRHLLVPVVLSVAFCALMIQHHPYQLDRIHSYLFREEMALGGGYQATHALIAMGSGGLSGRGYCGSVEKYFDLPAAITDSILAVIGEELGLIATWCVLGLFAWLLCRGMTIAVNAPDRFSGLVAAGVTCLLGVQALVNIAAVTAAIPTTGVPLPFVSYGGSSLLFSLIGVGLLLNVSRRGRSALSEPGTS